MVVAWFGGFGPGIVSDVPADVASNYYWFPQSMRALVSISKQLPRWSWSSCRGPVVIGYVLAKNRGKVSAALSHDLLAALEGTQRRIESQAADSESYLAKPTPEPRTGSFGWNLATAEVLVVGGTFRIFQYDERQNLIWRSAIHAFIPKTDSRATAIDLCPSNGRDSIRNSDADLPVAR